jgi:outer membrane protein W
MRSASWIVTLGFCLVHAASAQQRHELSLFASHSDAGYHATTGYGAAFSEAWTPRFSTAIAVGVEDPTVCVGGSFLERPCTQIKLKTHPIDLSGRYHFLNDTRWKPYLGAGLRYTPAPKLTAEQRTLVGHDYSDHVYPEAVGGVEFVVVPSFGITVEGKQLAGSRQPYDSLFNVSGALNWRF